MPEVVPVPVADARLMALLVPQLRRRQDLGPLGLDVLAALERLVAEVRAIDYAPRLQRSAERLQPPDTESVAEAAARLGISTQAVYKRLAAGTLPGWRDGNRWRVERPCDTP